MKPYMKTLQNFHVDVQRGGSKFGAFLKSPYFYQHFLKQDK